MWLFLDTHEQYIKNSLIKLICIQFWTFRHLTKKCIMKNMSEKTFRHFFFCGNCLPNTTLCWQRKINFWHIDRHTDHRNIMVSKAKRGLFFSLWDYFCRLAMYFKIKHGFWSKTLSFFMHLYSFYSAFLCMFVL